MCTLISFYWFLASFSFLPMVPSESSGASVYICTGKKAYSYHNNKNCRGLNNCQAEIKKVSMEYAKSINRKPCKICY